MLRNYQYVTDKYIITNIRIIIFYDLFILY